MYSLTWSTQHQFYNKYKKVSFESVPESNNKL